MSLRLSGHKPDILTCIANLSSDEVFTPPELASAMLDLVAQAWAEENDGANIWADPNVRFLDPCTKTGVFLREITRRLTEGLRQVIPDRQARVDHILTQQVFGIAITELTGLMARRSIYCSKLANGEHSICRSFDDENGNIWFQTTEHRWVKDGGKRKCQDCRANAEQYDRSDLLETHAYALIHADAPTSLITELFGVSVHFDVIIGNPPYQLGDGGHNTSATPIYQLFVDKALSLEPRIACFVTPSRWFAGGKGLDDYRARMLADHRLRTLVDFPKLYDGFPGVKIRGGVSYFLWDRDYDGPCTVQTMWSGEPLGEPVARYLDQFDVLVRRNEAVPILEKVRRHNEPTLEARVSSRKPFGLATNFRGQSSKAGMTEPIQLFAKQRTEWVEKSDLLTNVEWVDRWKVLVTAVQGTSAAVETKFLSKPIIAGPGTACTETYLVAGHFDSEEAAQYYASYLRTRFLRFLISLRKSTQHATKDVYAFAPEVPLDREWTDAMLYERYGLTEEEIAFVESQVAEHSHESNEAVKVNNGN